MSQQQHPATDWRVGPTISPVEGPHYATITDGNSRVADVYADFSSIPEMEANAAFIVQAVNAHADLVAVCQTIETLTGSGEKYWNLLTQARAALAKAGASIA